MNSSIWHIDGTLIGTFNPGPNGAGSNSNNSVLCISESSWTGASLSDGLVSYPGKN